MNNKSIKKQIERIASQFCLYEFHQELCRSEMCSDGNWRCVFTYIQNSDRDDTLVYTVILKATEQEQRLKLLDFANSSIRLMRAGTELVPASGVMSKLLVHTANQAHEHRS